MRREATYQTKLIKKLQLRFPGCHIIKNNPAHTQGIPDLLILIENLWAMLEIKKSETADKQPNQEHYVERFNNMGFASFISPKSEDRVLDDLAIALGLKP